MAQCVYVATTRSQWTRDLTLTSSHSYVRHEDLMTLLNYASRTVLHKCKESSTSAPRRELRLFIRFALTMFNGMSSMSPPYLTQVLSSPSFHYNTCFTSYYLLCQQHFNDIWLLSLACRWGFWHVFHYSLLFSIWLSIEVDCQQNWLLHDFKDQFDFDLPFIFCIFSFLYWVSHSSLWLMVSQVKQDYLIPDTWYQRHTSKCHLTWRITTICYDKYSSVTRYHYTRLPLGIKRRELWSWPWHSWALSRCLWLNVSSLVVLVPNGLPLTTATVFRQTSNWNSLALTLSATRWISWHCNRPERVVDCAKYHSLATPVWKHIGTCYEVTQ